MNECLCVALGDFDGVHLGHRQLILRAVNNKSGLIPAVYTFSENCKGSKILTDNREKERILSQLGIKTVIFDDFEKIRCLTPTEFVRNILHERLNASAVVCGEDFTFGYKALGNADVLKSLCKPFKIDVVPVEEYEFNGKKLSSSDIRIMIEDGNATDAAKVLGRYYSVSGRVIHGKHLGSENKTPTVNIALSGNRVVPAYGVYITRTIVGGKVFNSVSNVGVRPSVEQCVEPNVETNIFEFDMDVYGSEITVEFVKMLRREQKFSGREELFLQIAKDIRHAKDYFAENNNDKA